MKKKDLPNSTNLVKHSSFFVSATRSALIVYKKTQEISVRVYSKINTTTVFPVVNKPLLLCSALIANAGCSSLTFLFVAGASWLQRESRNQPGLPMTTHSPIL